MTEASRFLSSFGRALSSAALYSDGHPSLGRAMDSAWRDLTDLLARAPRVEFTFLGETVFFADVPLRERRSWEWGDRLSQSGLQRIQFDKTVTREGFDGFVYDVVSRLSPGGSTASARQVARDGIQSGSVALRSGSSQVQDGEIPAGAPALRYSMREEVETVRWLQDETKSSRIIPLVEAETIVRSLSVAMHSERGIVLPLLQLKDFDQYTTTHSLNVAVLAMALAEFLELGDGQVRSYGLAGLLHDIGKTRIPLDVLTKPGKLSDEERQVMNRHPSDGARLILASEQSLDLAAIVAYEHHIMIDGGGYPTMRFRRVCHQASRLVHVCDVFDALRTHRPYREAWPLEKVLVYLRERAGLEFDADLVSAFDLMVSKWEPRMTVLTSETEPLPLPAA